MMVYILIALATLSLSLAIAVILHHKKVVRNYDEFVKTQGNYWDSEHEKRMVALENIRHFVNKYAFSEYSFEGELHECDFLKSLKHCCNGDEQNCYSKLINDFTSDAQRMFFQSTQGNKIEEETE